MAVKNTTLTEKFLVSVIYSLNFRRLRRVVFTPAVKGVKMNQMIVLNQSGQVIYSWLKASAFTAVKKGCSVLNHVKEVPCFVSERYI